MVCCLQMILLVLVIPEKINFAEDVVHGFCNKWECNILKVKVL